MVHSLIHIISVAPYTEHSVCYASRVALSIIAEENSSFAWKKMQQILSSWESNPLFSTLCGYIFEKHAIETLEKGGTFTCRQLVHFNAKKPASSSITIQTSERQTVDCVEENITDRNRLYVPIKKNYTGIDAWMYGVGGFQMTLNEAHKISRSTKNDLKHLEHKLYWLLPPQIYENFTKKTLDQSEDEIQIEQFAILIPHPSIG